MNDPIQVLPTNEEGLFTAIAQEKECDMRSPSSADRAALLFVIETSAAAAPFIPEIKSLLKSFAADNIVMQGVKVFTYETLLDCFFRKKFL